MSLRVPVHLGSTGIPASDTGRAVQLHPAPPAQAQDLVLGLLRLEGILCWKIFHMSKFKESLH